MAIVAEERREPLPYRLLPPRAPRPAADLGRVPRAVALLSGGLDSTLAAALVAREGVEVYGLHLYTGLCITEAKRQKGVRARNPALAAAAAIGIPIELRDISDAYLDIITDPKHGYGANANPCIDCRAYMLRRAKEFGEEVGADFYVTGEVLGQRPKSQRRGPMEIVRREGGMEDRLLRPLSATLLPPTRPERSGWVRREAMQAFRGRTRKPQIALAKALGIEEYAQPAGGCCYLADEHYARKFFDFLNRRSEAGAKRTITPEEVLLLGTGRHFRLAPCVVAIVGRNEGENRFLERFRTGRWSLEAVETTGPLAILYSDPLATSPEPTEEDLARSAAIVARYAHGVHEKREVPVRARRDGEERIVRVRPIDEGALEELRIG